LELPALPDFLQEDITIVMAIHVASTGKIIFLIVLYCVSKAKNKNYD
jgi:hypothetical protein